MNKYYSLEAKKDKTVLTIYGDITSCPWRESDTSSYNLSKQLEGVHAKTIEVYINSYGGEIAEGLAIYNALKRNKAKVKTYVDGFACSIASVIAMAGDERYMYKSSLLMIHNAWTCASGNASELRKVADDLDVMTDAIIKAYTERSNLDEAEIQTLLNAETWLTAEDALEKGFITKIADAPKSNKQSANARNEVFKKMGFYKNEAGSDNDLEAKIDGIADSLSELAGKVDDLITLMSESSENSADPDEDDPDKPEVTTEEDDPDDDEDDEDDENLNNATMRFINAIKNL